MESRSGGIRLLNGSPVIRSVLSSRTRQAAGKSSVRYIHSCSTAAICFTRTVCAGSPARLCTSHGSRSRS